MQVRKQQQQKGLKMGMKTEMITLGPPYKYLKRVKGYTQL